MGTIVLDTSVLLGLLDPMDAHHRAAAALVRRHRADGDTFVVPATVLAETLVGACRERREDELTRRLRDAFGEPRAIDGDVAVAAARLRARHRRLRLPDAIVLAVAEVDAATAVLTADRAWSRIDKRVRVVAASRSSG